SWTSAPTAPPTSTPSSTTSTTASSTAGSRPTASLSRGSGDVRRDRGPRVPARLVPLGLLAREALPRRGRAARGQRVDRRVERLPPLRPPARLPGLLPRH